MEQTVKDFLQLGFSFFVAGYLLIVQTRILTEVKEQTALIRQTLDKIERLLLKEEPPPQRRDEG